ncbi:glycerophosphodiester phosphodiesterase [Pengzhenrongella phosphoraccumulans]|uniref:glycerophosphodiester phosphodiesterase n=1 Tax=Pengzhenrongella phosphoraccumulans TaxID=3114394 RepID=UPI00388EF166
MSLFTKAAALVLPPRTSAEPAGATRVLAVAHRGASADAPENTLAAVRRAITLGASLIELDVQRTRDGKLVVFHDATLTRTTDAARVFPDRAPWHLADFTLAEVLTLDAGSWNGAQFAGERVPTLADAIRALRTSGSGLLLELKSPGRYPGIEDEVADLMREFRGYVRSAVATGRLAVQSLDVDSLRRYHRAESRVPVALLGRPAPSDLPALATWVDGINPFHLAVDAAYVAEVHRLGLDCRVWTVDTVADLTRALDLGVDGVITNRPDLLTALLDERRDRLAGSAA